MGAPEITPVVASSVSPPGSSGLTVNCTDAPPVTVGVFDVPTPLVYTAGAALYLSRLGALSLIANSRSWVSEPPEFVAVTVYVVLATIAVGVPVITPVLESSASPNGSAGATANDVDAPLVTIGVFGAGIATPLVYTIGVAVLYLSNDGAISLTAMSRVVLLDPPEFVAFTVYVFVGTMAVPVPVMIPVLASITRPTGSTGETVNTICSPPPPVTAGVFGAGTSTSFEYTAGLVL